MFTTDTRTETFLAQLGVAFRYTNKCSVAALHTDWSKVNIGRPVPVREDAVLEYAALMESGSPAPAPIAYSLDGEIALLDGVQRVSAAMLIGCTWFSAYVVESDSDDMLATIRVLSNARLQGRPEPPEWTRRRAVEVLIVQRGMSSAEVARMGGWKEQDLVSIAEAIQWGEAIEAIGGPKLPDTMLSLLSRNTDAETITRAPDAVAEFLKAIKSCRFSADDAEVYVAQFFAPIAKTSRTRQVLQDRLEEILDDPEVTVRLHGRRGSTLPVDVNLRRSLRTVKTVLSEIVQTGQTLADVDEFFGLISDVRDMLHQCSPKHRKRQTANTPADMWKK